MNFVANDFIERAASATERAPCVGGPPIFLTGFARSGTTWVNRLMQNYFDAGFVNEGQFIISFGKRIRRYGDLEVVRNRGQLARDLARDRFFSILSKNYKVDIDWDRVVGNAGSFPETVKDILSQIAERTGKHRIGSKYPVFGRHLSLLNDFFPDCMVIHVVRDGRDCALSHKGVRWGHQNTYSAAVHWRRYMQTIRHDASAMLGRYLEVRYEDLLLEPETTVRTLEHFITGAHEYPITGRFIGDAGISKVDRTARWRQAMPALDQAIFEAVAGDMLERCGYPLTGLARRPPFFSRMGYVLHDRLTREGWNVARKVFRNMPERK